MILPRPCSHSDRSLHASPKSIDSEPPGTQTTPGGIVGCGFSVGHGRDLMMRGHIQRPPLQLRPSQCERPERHANPKQAACVAALSKPHRSMSGQVGRPQQSGAGDQPAPALVSTASAAGISARTVRPGAGSNSGRRPNRALRAHDGPSRRRQAIVAPAQSPRLAPPAGRRASGRGRAPSIPGIFLPLVFSPPRAGGPVLSAAAHSSSPFKAVSGAQTTAREWCHMRPEDST